MTSPVFAFCCCCCIGLDRFFFAFMGLVFVSLCCGGFQVVMPHANWFDFARCFLSFGCLWCSFSFFSLLLQLQSTISLHYNPLQSNKQQCTDKYANNCTECMPSFPYFVTALHTCASAPPSTNHYCFGTLCYPCSANCRSCSSSASYCTSCPETLGYFNAANHSCQNYPVSGDYCSLEHYGQAENLLNSTKACYPCHESCQSCSGLTENDCTSCAFSSAFSYFDVSRHSCSSAAPAAHYCNSTRICLGMNVFLCQTVFCFSFSL